MSQQHHHHTITIYTQDVPTTPPPHNNNIHALSVCLTTPPVQQFVLLSESQHNAISSLNITNSIFKPMNSETSAKQATAVRFITAEQQYIVLWTCSGFPSSGVPCSGVPCRTAEGSIVDIGVG